MVVQLLKLLKLLKLKMKPINQILSKQTFSKEEIIQLLSAKGSDEALLFAKARQIKEQYVGNAVYLRGLVEYSNRCKKNCLYCGIRAGNADVGRYTVNDDEVVAAAKYAYEKGFGSMVLQSGECSDERFVNDIELLLKQIMQATNNELGITLSLGEQREETYLRWREAGAKRYLLRIEASDADLYAKIHPEGHSYEERLKCLKILQKLDFQLGTGVMIGLPFQTLENLADDLLFIKNMDIDMVGMGPYIEHENTPLYVYKNQLLSKKERFDLSMKMVAVLRILMKDINIAATTAMQALHPQGRQKAIEIGANVVMPNLTPMRYRDDYLLYEDKPGIQKDSGDLLTELEAEIQAAGAFIAYNQHGDSQHFRARTN